MILKEVLDKTTQFFKDKKFETARLDSELLISKALGLTRVELYMKYEQPLQDKEVETCRDFVRRRSQGEPVAYILGSRDFYKLNFKVDSRVLIPRPETETLVETVLELMKKSQQEKFEILDLGCGSGCIGLSVAKHEPRSRVTLIDSSLGATEVTTINQQNLGLSETSTIVHSDAMSLETQGKTFDFILSNPPYIAENDPEVQAEVRKFEPSSALFAAEEGYSDIRAWSKKYSACLKPGGVMIFEIGYRQAENVKAQFENLNIFESVKLIQDFSGHQRFIMGKARGVDHG